MALLHLYGQREGDRLKVENKDVYLFIFELSHEHEKASLAVLRKAKVQMKLCITQSDFHLCCSLPKYIVVKQIYVLNP